MLAQTEESSALRRATVKITYFSPKQQTSIVLAGAGVLSGLLVSGQLDLVGEVVVQLDIGLLGESVFGDGLERLLHVDGLFGAGFKVRDVVLALTPALGSFRGNLRKETHFKIEDVVSMQT